MTTTDTWIEIAKPSRGGFGERAKGVKLSLTKVGLVVRLAGDVATGAGLAAKQTVTIAIEPSARMLRLRRVEGLGGFRLSKQGASLVVRIGLRALPETMLLACWPWADLSARVSKGEIQCTLPKQRPSPARNDALVAKAKPRR